MKINITIDTENDTLSIYDTSGGTGEFTPPQKDLEALLETLVECSYDRRTDIFLLPTQTFKALEFRGKV